MKLHTTLIDLLKTDPRFVDDTGELVLAAVQDSGWKMDHDLVRLLLSNADLEATFFDDIDGHRVFNLNTFIDYISQKEFLDNSYTGFKNRIGLTVGGRFLSERGEVALVWPYKDTVLEGGQTKEQETRKEIFFNEVLAQDEINRLFDPKVLTNFVRYTAKGKQPVKELRRDESGTVRENLVIKGNNLLALASLKKEFAGKVKLIYIDPPYNISGDEFNYNDTFNESTWLTFMRNRLTAAKDLLTEDGTIVIQIDDNEMAPLKIVVDEIFKRSPQGKKNFVQFVEVKTNVGAANEYQNPFMPKNCEYLLIYAKNYDKRIYKPEWIKSEIDENYKYFVKDPSEKSSKWIVTSVRDEFNRKYGEEKWNDAELLYEFYLKNIQNIFRTISPKGPGKRLEEALEKSKIHRVSEYLREDEERVICYRGELVRFYSKNLKKDINDTLVISRELGSLWTDISWTGIANEGGVKLKKGKKPEKMIRRIIDMCSERGEIVLDYHLGSGTTCAVAHKMGRQYIGIEQLDYGENDSVVRLTNVIAGDTTGISKSVKWQGGGEFIYCELMKFNEAFMHRIQDAKTSEDLVEIWQHMGEGSFLNWYVNPARPEDAVRDFEAIGKEPDGLHKQKHLLAGLLDKNQLYVNLSEIDDAQFKVSKEDKALNKAFYGNAYDA